jgi:hypothetical protein
MVNIAWCNSEEEKKNVIKNKAGNTATDDHNDDSNDASFVYFTVSRKVKVWFNIATQVHLLFS